MEYIYAMSDIHGEYELFLEMLCQIKFTEKDKLYVLGDVIDRGPKSIKMLQYLKDRSNITMLLGNHEQMFLDYLNAAKCDKWEAYLYKEHWFRNGGEVTYNEFLMLSEKQQEDIVNYLESRSLYEIVDDVFILTHAGINVDDKVDDIHDFMQNQNSEDLLWIREDFHNKKAIDDYIVIFGHTPTCNILYNTKKIEEKFFIWEDPIYKDKIGIDCGVIRRDIGGKLGCLRLNDMKEFYVE